MGAAGDNAAKAPAAAAGSNGKGTAASMDVVSSSSSSSPAPAPSVLKSVLLSYAYVSVWITLSFSVIVYNKYILDPKMYNWPFPISLTMIHMAFCASLAVVLVRVLRVVAVPASPPMTPSLYAASVVPIGALYALSLWFSNSAYIYLSVSFIQMLKALMPVAARFDAFGVMLQLAAVAAEATRLVLIQILLTSKGMSLNPITSLYYIAPCCLVFLTLPWYFVELPRLRAAAGAAVRPDVFVFGTNSLCAFALNLAVFLLVGKTSALTMNVAGVVKDWLLIAFSWTVIKDTVTPVNLVGYGIAFLGVAYYNHAKLQGLKAREAERRAASMATAKDGDAEAGARLLPEKDAGEQKN
uniref:Sugar phosphate transporter domain-containing protein n=1 Tax=Oryza nivara TaxID=4536 RepID=A0A0E0IY40_ORYNI